MRILKRGIPDWQGVHRFKNLLTQMFWGLASTDTHSGQLKFAHGFNVKLKDVGLDRIKKAHLYGPFLIVHREGFIVGSIFRNVFDPEPTVGNIIVNLTFI